MSKVPNFSNVMGQFAPQLQELDHEINVLDTQRRSLAQQRSNAVIAEFHHLVPEVEFGKTVVTHLQDRGGYRGKPIERTGIVRDLQLKKGYNGLSWSMPILHLTRLTSWDRKHWEADVEDFSKYNRRTTHNDHSSNISVGEEFEIVGEVTLQGKWGLYVVKFL